VIVVGCKVLVDNTVVDGTFDVVEATVVVDAVVVVVVVNGTVVVLVVVVVVVGGVGGGVGIDAQTLSPTQTRQQNPSSTHAPRLCSQSSAQQRHQAGLARAPNDTWQ
jgi:hypothetical protein